MWLTKLKIAVVERNTENLDKLMDSVPELTDIKDIEETLYLIQEASELVHTLKDDTAHTMNQIQKNLKFLRSTEAPLSSKLDIKS